MSQSKAEAIVARLLSNAAGLKFGSVSVTVKVHSGRIMDVTHTVTESMKEAGSKEDDAGDTA
ncbi:MAG: hypothetical protein LBH43_10250 [Treponema sp.]|jgi:hypothetical protein|nr:hypothetical protein [Treponema sp.]